MINKKIGVLLLFALLVSFGAKAQRATSMRINEVLVINEDNFVDDYGKRHAWIELFNNSAGSVNIAGCYLTNDKSNPKKYLDFCLYRFQPFFDMGEACFPRFDRNIGQGDVYRIAR